MRGMGTYTGIEEEATKAKKEFGKIGIRKKLWNDSQSWQLYASTLKGISE